MDDPPSSPPDSADELEVSDLRDASIAAPASVRDAGRPLLTPRQRLRRLAVTGGSVLLALLILIASMPGLRAGAGAWLGGFIPTPTATLPPGTDRFYFIESVTGTQLSIDGQPVPHLPRIGADPPLELARGQYRLSWTAAPFLPQSCILSVPFSVSDTCGAPIPLFARASSVTAYMLLLRDQLAAIPGSQESAVMAAVQNALANFSSDIEPGDHYLLQTATQPLRGTLHFQLDTRDTPGMDAACAPSSQQPYVTCALDTNACAVLCTIPTPALANAGIAVMPSAWYAATFISLLWIISTPDGRTPLAKGTISQGGAAVADYGMLLALTLDSAGWHALPVFGSGSGALLQRLNSSRDTINQQLLGAPGCAAMPDFFSTNGIMQSDSPVTFLADSNPADGCLAVVPVPSASGTQTAYYLYRFGMLIAVNDVAQREHSMWPDASAHERQIAQMILSSGTPAT